MGNAMYFRRILESTPLTKIFNFRRCKAKNETGAIPNFRPSSDKSEDNMDDGG